MTDRHTDSHAERQMGSSKCIIPHFASIKNIQNTDFMLKHQCDLKFGDLLCAAFKIAIISNISY